MVNYLKSPMWTTEICNFIDENCIFFGDEDENSFEHTDIHKEFTKLIDIKLDTFCAEIGIDYDTFILACGKITNKLHGKCIDQIVAMENYLFFKQMMVARNKKLNQLAMIEIEKVDGINVPKSAAVQAQFDAEEAELQQALEMSKALMDAESQTNADTPLQKQKEKIEVQIVAKKKQKQKVIQDEVKPSNDSQFPDIFSKPGKFLPSLIDKEKNGGFGKFEEINIDDDDLALKAKNLQDKLIA